MALFGGKRNFEGGDEMPFLEHLEQLRWHIMRGLIAMLAVTIVIFIVLLIPFGELNIAGTPFDATFFDFIIFGPVTEDFPTRSAMCNWSQTLLGDDSMCIKLADFNIINTKLQGQFIAHLKVSLLIGFGLSFPYFFWEVWRFVKPGLRRREVDYTRGITFFTSMLFIIGGSFGYFIMSPFAVNFLYNYKAGMFVTNMISLGDYIGNLTMYVAASGFIFELPMIVYTLSKLGILTPDLMRKYRRHMVVGLMMLAAVITPQDVFTMFIVFIPLYLLFEISIFISAAVQRNYEKKWEEADDE